MQNKAMVLEKFNSPLAMREFEIPKLHEGQILIRIEAAGVCGSDIHMYLGEDPRLSLPIILGHEGIGIVVEICGTKNYVDGSQVQVGDRVLWNRGLTCGQCHACTILKEPSLCSNRSVYGINMVCSDAVRLNGCYSEHIVLRRNSHLFKIDADIDPAVLVSASCSGATIAHGFDGIESLIGKTVLVQGSGPLGFYAVAFARSLGASKIIMVGSSKIRLDLAGEFGATHTIDWRAKTFEQRNELVKELTHGKGVDLIIEAAGTEGAAEEGIRLLSSGGIYVSTGYAQPAGFERIDFYSDVVKKNITIKGVWVSDASHTYRSIQLVLDNSELFQKLISHKFKLEDANEALEQMRQRSVLKAVLIP